MKPKRAFYNMSDLNALARGYTEDCITILVEIMRANETPPAARVRAAELLLLRGWGQPQQYVNLASDQPVLQKIIREIVYMPPPDEIESINDMNQPLEITFVRNGNGNGNGSGGLS